METIKFRIIKINNDMCRIEASDYRSVYREISDEACICSLEIMFEEMQRIKKEVERFRNKVVFVID